MTITTPRALLDWYRRPKKRSRAQLQEESEEGAPRMPGVAGMTKHRLMLDLSNRRVADQLLRICDEALADPELHEAKRNAIESTRRQIVAALEEPDHD